MRKFFIFFPYVIVLFCFLFDSTFLSIFLKFDIFYIFDFEKYLYIIYEISLLVCKTLFNLCFFIFLYLYNILVFLFFYILKIYFSCLYFILFLKLSIILFFIYIKNFIFFIFVYIYVHFLSLFFYNLFYIYLYIFSFFTIFFFENCCLKVPVDFDLNLVFDYFKNFKILLKPNISTLKTFFYFSLMHKSIVSIFLSKFYIFNFDSFYFLKINSTVPFLNSFFFLFIFTKILFYKLNLIFFSLKYIFAFNIFFFILDFFFYIIGFFFGNFNFLFYYTIKLFFFFLLKSFFFIFYIILNIIPAFLQIIILSTIFSIKIFIFDIFFFINNSLKFIVFIFIQLLRFGFDFFFHDYYITTLPSGNKDYWENDFHIDYNLFKRIEIVGFSHKPYFKAFYNYPPNKLVTNKDSVINNFLNIDDSSYDIIIDFKKLKKSSYFQNKMTPQDLKNFTNYFYLSHNTTIHVHDLLNTSYYIRKDPFANKEPLNWLQSSFHDFMLKRYYTYKLKRTYFNYSELFYNLDNVSWRYLLTTLKTSYIAFVLLHINLNLVLFLFVSISMFTTWFYFNEWLEYRLIEKDHFNFANFILDNILIIKNQRLRKLLLNNTFFLEIALYINLKLIPFLKKNYISLILAFSLILYFFFF